MTLEINYSYKNVEKTDTIFDVFQFNYVYDENKASWFFICLTHDDRTYRYLLDLVNYFHLK